MLGETDENWRDCIERTLALDPDSVTIYQMELPYNTTISSDILKHTGQFADPVANWATKRRWVDEAFAALERAGYHIGSAYTAVKNPGDDDVRVSRSAVGRAPISSALAWRRSATSTACTCRTWTRGRNTATAIERDEIPLGRAYRPTSRGAHDPRVRAAAETRRAAAGLLRDASTASTCSSASPNRSRRCRGTATSPARIRSRIALTREGCCASTSCCRASSSRSTPGFAIRNDSAFYWVLRFYWVLHGSFEVSVTARDHARQNRANASTNTGRTPNEPGRTWKNLADLVEPT